MTLNHVAVRPARNDIGERVYARRWSELMSRDVGVMDRTPLEKVLVSYPYEVDQQAAHLAASFITWLGTNCGRSFLETAKEFESARTIRSFAYLAAWSVHNARSIGFNSNARQIEFLIRTQEQMEKNIFSEVSVRDLEAADQVALWLGSDDGQEFIAACEKEISRRKELDSYATLVAQGKGDSLQARRLATKIATL